MFKKNNREKGWVIDPSLKAVKRCFKQPNCDRDIISSPEVFATNSAHKYLIPNMMGSSIREELEVKENAFIHYGSSFGAFIPLFIYKDESLILVTFRTERNKVFAEYHEMKENHAFEKIAHIDRHLRNTNSCMIAAKFLLLLTLFLQKP